MSREDTFLDLRPPKSPKRFFIAAFSPLKSLTQAQPMPPVPTMPLPLPPIGVAPYTPAKSSSTPRKSHTPSSSTSSFGQVLGAGAQVVRTPSDALRGLQQPTTPGAARDTSDPGLLVTNDVLRSPIRPARPQRPQRSDVDKGASVDSPPGGGGGTSASYDGSADLGPGLPLFPASPSPAPSPHAVNITKRSAQKSLSPSPRLQNDMGPMSTFDPFGLGDTVFNAEDKADRRNDIARKTAQVAHSPKEGPASDERRATVKPPSRPVTCDPFHAILKTKTSRPAPTSTSEVLVTLEFGYSLDDPPKNTSVSLPWSILAKAGGHLVRLAREHLGEEEAERESSVPEMTDGSSAESSDRESGSYDLDGLLRDEYLKSLWISSPSQLHFPLPPPLPPVPARRSSMYPKTVKKRAATRNQYIQQAQFPSPGSTFVSPTSLAVRRHGPEPKLQLEEADGGGTITELTVLITRDAAAYHVIAARLSTGEWSKMDSAKRKRVEGECRWLGMEALADEMADLRGKSMVLRGGSGYI